MTFPFEMVPLLGDVRYFSEGGKIIAWKVRVKLPIPTKTNLSKIDLSHIPILNIEFTSPSKKTRGTLNLKKCFNHKTSFLVGGWTNPFEKYARQNGFIFPDFRGEKKKYLSCHHLVLCFPKPCPSFRGVAKNAVPPGMLRLSGCTEGTAKWMAAATPKAAKVVRMAWKPSGG